MGEIKTPLWFLAQNLRWLFRPHPYGPWPKIRAGYFVRFILVFNF